MKKAVVRKLRCAVYTRKSSEEGLDMEFNSLDAQREACEAYVASQKTEGWLLVPDRYDDGGFSGGTLERPALQRLIADLEVPISIRRRGERRLVLAPDGTDVTAAPVSRHIDSAMVKAIARARVDAEQADALAMDFDGVAVDDGGNADDAVLRVRAQDD